MLSRGLSAPLLLLLLQGALLLDAKPSDKPYKIDGPFIKKFRGEELSRQKRFLDGFFKDVFDISEKNFLNTDWKGNIFSNHHQIYNPYVPNIPQYYPGWSVATDACIWSNNKKVSVVSSIRECQMMCLQEASFICRAVEYEPYSGTCSLTDGTSASADYVQPCTQGGWLFIERIDDWTEPTYACIYSTHKNILEEKVWSIDDCKTRCIEETSFECRSLGYIWWTQTCSLSPETSSSSNFMMPCVIQQYTYIERIYVTPTSNPCSADPCGHNAACVPNGDRFNCQCADGFTGIPPNCNLYQVTPTSNPCSADPCGSNSVCFPNGDRFNCQCADGFTGIPPNCNLYQDCVDHNDCPSNHACVGWKCLDPCIDRCGENSNCQVYNHYPSCTCQENYTGNPYLFCSEIAVTTTVEIDTTNTTTTELPGEKTNNTTENTHSCVNQSNCPSNYACVGGTCVDPCVARCGPNAECQVYNLQGWCSCSTNYTGNPYSYCSVIDETTTESVDDKIENTNTTTMELPDGQTETTTEESQSCVNQSDCPSNRACVGGTCMDPCVARCGPNAECQVHNRQGHCSCSTNYTGNPYLNCLEIDETTTESVDDKIENTNTTTLELPDDQTVTTTEESQNAATTESIDDKIENKNTTTELPDDLPETSTEESQGFETTVAVESQTDANDEGTATDPQKDQDSDSTEAPIAPTLAYVEPTVTEINLTEVTETSLTEVTETSLAEVTDLPEEITTVDPEVRRRIEFPDFNR